MTEESGANEDGVREVSREQAREMVAGGAQLIDVRADHEWETGHIPGATHIRLEELPQKTGEIDSDRQVVVYCRGGTRSSMAAEALADAGFDTVKLSEGVVGWEEEGLEMEPEDGYVAESGEAAALIEARKRTSG